MTSLEATPKPAIRLPAILREVLFQLHLYTGLFMAIPVIPLGLSGSILVYHEEIEAMIAPAPKATAAGPAQSAGAIAAAALSARDGFVATQIVLPEAAGDAAMVRLASAPREGAPPARPGQGPQVFVDPASLEVLGTRDGAAVPFLRLMHDLHGNFLMGAKGREQVGGLGFAMLALGITGIVLWWPKPGRWRQAFTIRRRAQGYTLMRDLHGAAGIWGLLVYLLVTISGIAIAFPQESAALIGAKSPAGGPRGPAVVATPEEIDIAAHLAADAVPHAQLIAINAPRRAGQPFRVTMRSEDRAEGAPVITVSADPGTGTVEVRDPATLPAAERLLIWQRPLHEGQGLGAIWRALVFLSGFLPLIFGVTGVWMWVVKRRARRRMAKG